MKPRAVRLNVRDSERVGDFYRETIGLRALGTDGGVLRMGVGEETLVELVPSPSAPGRPPGTTGLFHLAILLETRHALALALRRVAGSGWSLTGVADHLVSEALYLDDPEGNGIELYRDRPPEDWPRAGGEIKMATLPLDLDRLVAEATDADDDEAVVPASTRIGHVHLNVADLRRAEAFYCELLGFDVTTRGFPGALFVSTGGYHHHVGLNTWNGPGAPPPPPGALGLSHFELAVDDTIELERLRLRLAEAGVHSDPAADRIAIRDPSGNGVLVTAG